MDISFLQLPSHMYIGNGDLCPGVLYIASGPSSCRNRSQRIAALPVLIFYFEYCCLTLQRLFCDGIDKQPPRVSV